jgi:PAS domain S-box-containing protein
MESSQSSLSLTFEEIFVNAPDAVVVHSLEDVVLAWNPQAEKLYGWSQDEIKGRAVTKIFYLDREARARAVESLHDQGRWEGELRQFDRNGDEYLVRVRQTLHRDAAGEALAVISFNTNNTAARKIEDAVERAHHIRSTSLLASGFGHEMNNVLAPIMLSSAMLKRSLEDEKSKNMVGMIEKCATKGAALVADLLSFERGKGGSDTVVRKTQVERAVKRVAGLVVPESVELKLTVVEDLWELHGEILELTNVFEAIMQNACEAMPEGGRLSIEINNREFDETFASLAPEASAGAYVSVVFSDTGCGIESEMIAHIAEPFFTTKRPKQGFGFGLASAQVIVKGHEGFMVVESARGTGTTLSIYLPAISPDVEKVASVPTETEGQGKIVLVADDEFFIREAIKKTLKARGYKVLVAQDGTEALATYVGAVEPISMVITNLEMPYMDGPALCRALQKLNPEIKILVSSGHRQGSQVQAAKASGVQHFLTKPYTADDLADKVHAVLDT